MFLHLLCFTLLLRAVVADDNDYVDLSNNKNNIASSEANESFIESEIRKLFVVPTASVIPNGIPNRSLNIFEQPVEQFCSGGGICVPHYLCLNNSINIGGEGLIVSRFNLDIDEENECHYMSTCCARNNVLPNSNIPVIREFRGCGYRQVNGSLYRISERNNEAQYAEFPWMVAIMKEVLTNTETIFGYQCGGALIHPEVVLTAAHCVTNKRINRLKVRVGEWDTQTNTEYYPYQERGISQIIIQEEFYKGTLYNDIALLFLQERVDFAPNVQTICIPPVNTNFDGNECIATGWGKDVFGIEGKYQVIMKKIVVPIVPRNICQNFFRRTRLGRRFVLHSSFICAGGESGVDTCTGDGGSPLVCPIPGTVNRYYQAGIVAWGIDCGLEHVPGAYVNVSRFRTWIDQQFELKGLDSSYYTP